MCVADASDVAVKAGDGIVNLTWTRPDNAVDVEVRKLDRRPPAKRSEGTPLAGVRRSGVTDTNVQNGRAYGYLVSMIYRRDDGKRFASRGIPVTAAPDAPPEPLRSLQAERKGDKVRLGWTVPARGLVEVYRLPKDPGISIRDHQDIGALSSLGRKVPSVTEHSAEDQLGGERVAYYLPISVAGSVGVVGKGVYVTAVDDVDDVKVSINGANMLVKWKWPPNTRLCRITVRPDQFASGPEDPNASKVDVLLTSYEAKGGLYMTVPGGAAAIHLTVHAGLDVESQTIFAAGLHPGAKSKVALRGRTGGQCELLYDIESPGGWFRSSKSHRVLLYGGDQEIRLPRLCLVAKQRTIPLKVSDGQILQAFPAGFVVRPHDEVFLNFSPGRVAKGTLVRLFTENPTDADWLRLVPKKPRMTL